MCSNPSYGSGMGKGWEIAIAIVFGELLFTNRI